MFWYFLIALGAAWLAQSWFSFKQSQSFGRLFVALRRKGRVAMGRFKGGLVQGAIVLFVIDEAGCILEGHKLQGITVAARFKPFSIYDGQDLHEINPALTKRHGGPAVKAVENARANLRIVSAGGHPPEPPTALSRVMLRLPLPKLKSRQKKSAAPAPIAPLNERIKVSRAQRPGERRSPMEGARMDRTA